MERTGFSLQTADFGQFAPNHPEKLPADSRMVGHFAEKPIRLSPRIPTGNA